jgi:hypothetical protein
MNKWLKQFFCVLALTKVVLTATSETHAASSLSEVLVISFRHPARLRRPARVLPGVPVVGRQVAGRVVVEPVVVARSVDVDRAVGPVDRGDLGIAQEGAGAAIAAQGGEPGERGAVRGATGVDGDVHRAICELGRTRRCT